MEMNEDKYLVCPVCKFDSTHFVTTIELEDDDCYHLIAASINGTKILILKNIEYPYRSQKSAHLLFVCEDQHYFHKSFDGHKGIISIDCNPIMDQLCNYLNETKIEYNMDITHNLTNEIRVFFKEKII